MPPNEFSLRPCSCCVLRYPHAIDVSWGNSPLTVLSAEQGEIVVEVGAGLQRGAELTVAHLVRSASGDVAQVVRSEGLSVDYAPPSVSHAVVVDAETRSETAREWRVRVRVSGSSFGVGGLGHTVVL